MKENNHKIKIKNNAQINLNNQISKPSYLMTVNPDKYLQKTTRKQAISIKDRNELNPEMAEIVRKILIKRKKEKNKNENTNNNNNSMIKSRKVDSIKKYFDDNYNKKHGLNKEKYYKLNKTLIFDSLQDRIGTENNNMNYIEYMNKINNNINNNNNNYNNIKRNKINISTNYSCSRNSKNITKNYGQLKINKNNVNECKSVQRKKKKVNKKISDSLNFEENEYDEYSPKNIQKIKIIKNNQYIVNLNSITIDIDEINKDKNILDINCSNLDDKINSRLLSPLKEKNNDSKKNILIKNINTNFLDENNNRKTINSLNKNIPLTQNDNLSEIKIIDTDKDINIKNKILDIDKKNFNNIKMNNNKKLIKKNKDNNKLILNKSTENRNQCTLNNNSNNEQYNITFNNGFYSGNIPKNNKINNNININEIKKQKLNINGLNQKDIRKEILNASFRKENKEKLKKDLNNKKFNNKNILYNIKNKKFNSINHHVKDKASPTYSKNDSNLSTERSLNYKKNTKVKTHRNNINNLEENRSLSKDYFQTENQKFGDIKNNKDHYDTLRMNISNKSNVIRKNKNKNKNNKIEEKNNIINELKSNNFLTNQREVSNRSLQPTNNNVIKKEYPNMAKFLYGVKQNVEITDEEQIKASKNRETKVIKKIESICKKGYSGPGVKKTNQDNFFIYNNFNNNSNYTYLGVCDGHGLFGQDISTYLVNNLPQNMNQNVINKGLKNLSNEKITTLSNLFQETFIQTNTSLNDDERIDSSFSGSTCVSLLFTPTRICCINVGDSRCIIGKFDGYEWISKALSRDHKPSEPDEMNRILKYGGRVESFRDNYGNFVGPERVWNTDMNGPGLAMSRSFGDEIAHKIGVVVDPEILEYFCLKEDKFIILGSDGIWEFISNDEVVDIVKDYYLDNNIEGAIEHLYNEASKRWIMEEEVIDDITIIIIFLN